MALHDHDDFDVSVQFPSPLRPSAECVVERGTSPAVLVAEYRYNGLNQRITAHFDTDADGDVDGDDPVTHFAYDSRWRIVARFEDTNTDPTEQFVFHHAGLASAGSGSYIDAVILRDRDTNANGTLDERVYHLQNWRSDVVALISAAGTQIEQVRYEPYGTPFGIPAGDTNADGDVTSGDVNQVTTWYSTSAYNVRGDLDMDGIVSISDVAYVAANEYLGHSTGRGELSLVANRKGYAGYENLAELEASGTKWDVRIRVLISEIGTWNRKTGLGSKLRPGELPPFGSFRSERGADAFLSPGLPLPFFTESPDDRCNRSGFEPDQRTSGECWKQSEMTICAQVCGANPRADGMTFCAAATPPPHLSTRACCVCDINIQSNYNTYPDDALAIIVACTERHERHHRDAQNCQPVGNECCEIVPYALDWSCLLLGLIACPDQPCRNAIIDQMAAVRREWLDAWAACSTKA